VRHIPEFNLGADYRATAPIFVISITLFVVTDKKTTGPLLTLSVCQSKTIELLRYRRCEEYRKKQADEKKPGRGLVFLLPLAGPREAGRQARRMAILRR
jgi:hypothetical protein